MLIQANAVKETAVARSKSEEQAWAIALEKEIINVI
jgi:hypothetical protein